jgi:hypothetical protein
MRLQRSIVVAALLAALAAAGCGGGGRSGAAQHPLTNTLDPEFPTLAVRTLAALPFASDVRDDEDPDGVAAGMAESKFYQTFAASRADYTVLGASEVARVIERDQLAGAMAAFYKRWIGNQSEVETEFIQKVAAALDADAVVAGVVDVWHQQPVDIMESGTARTSVGMLIGVFHGKTGKRIWLGRDENFKDALRYTPNESESELARTQARGQMERSNLRTATGAYAPPDFAAVLDLVVPPLVQAFPKRQP